MSFSAYSVCSPINCTLLLWHHHIASSYCRACISPWSGCIQVIPEHYLRFSGIAVHRLGYRDVSCWAGHDTSATPTWYFILPRPDMLAGQQTSQRWVGNASENRTASTRSASVKARYTGVRFLGQSTIASAKAHILTCMPIMQHAVIGDSSFAGSSHSYHQNM